MTTFNTSHKRDNTIQQVRRRLTRTNTFTRTEQTTYTRSVCDNVNHTERNTAVG